VRRLLVGLLLVCTAACSEPPRKEIDQAQSAIDAARAAGADQYAPDEYAAAAATLQKAQDSVDQRDYRQALSYAIDARQRAIEASRLVPEAKTHAKAAAETAYKTASDRTAHLETLLQNAETAKVPARELRAPQEALAAARASLQEARMRIDRGQFPEASSALLKVRQSADAAAAAVEAIPVPARPRPPVGKKR
jgi:predicted S18 family serine protease